MRQSGRHTFPVECRIRKRQDFIDIKHRGRRLRTPHFYIHFLPARTDYSRLGITVSRRVGNAAERNRVKRLIREFYRLNRHCFMEGFDISIVARKGAERLGLGSVSAELLVLQEILDRSSDG